MNQQPTVNQRSFSIAKRVNPDGTTEYILSDSLNDFSLVEMEEVIDLLEQVHDAVDRVYYKPTRRMLRHKAVEKRK